MAACRFCIIGAVVSARSVVEGEGRRGALHRNTDRIGPIALPSPLCLFIIAAVEARSDKQKVANGVVRMMLFESRR